MKEPADYTVCMRKCANVKANQIYRSSTLGNNLSAVVWIKKIYHVCTTDAGLCCVTAGY